MADASRDEVVVHRPEGISDEQWLRYCQQLQEWWDENVARLTGPGAS